MLHDRPIRHSWVRLSGPEGLATSGAPAVLVQWVAEGRPLIVTSAGGDDPSDRVRLGLALPDKTRIGALAVRSHMVDVMPPPLLDDILDQAPPAWRPTLEAVIHALPGRCRVYGSFAWQVRTRLNYVRPDQSDLDVTVAVADGDDADQVCSVLARFEGGSGPRLDGELVFASGGAVAWREWEEGAALVLVKRHGGPAIWARPDLEGRA